MLTVNWIGRVPADLAKITSKGIEKVKIVYPYTVYTTVILNGDPFFGGGPKLLCACFLKLRNISYYSG